ncbi:hypothetical protein H2248_001982 [Termitomyces sp. 'cryptogamus']|nr:hypothetical protein H2248_001982 [Termitomyces sp. 'cryptogamus']
MATETEGIDLSYTFAPIYWGFVVSLLLGGITIVQGYIYFFSSQKDRSLVQWTATLMLVLDLASSALIAQSVYYYLIPHFGSLLPLNAVTSELSAECLVSTLITFISQLYFVYQLYVVKHLAKGQWLVVGLITICAFLAFAGGVACVVTMIVYRHGVLANRNGTFAIFFGIAKGFGTITDVLATIAMCMYLTSARTGILQTKTLLNRVVGFVIHRGALVTLIQTLLLVTFYALPHSLCWFAFHINVTKLYANTFFAMLNGRNHYKQKHSVQSSALTPNFTSTRNTLKRKNDHYDFRTFDLQDDAGVGIKSTGTITKTVTVEVAEL